jgi:predicted enzyme related to lactoylglutathione lyase
MAQVKFTGQLVCSLQVKDHKASARWYEEMLCCQTVFENDEMGMTFMSTPVGSVHFDLSQVESPQNPGGATLVFGVEDCHAAREAIECKGVRFDGETRDFGGMVRLATFFDPDGNTLMFYQSLQQA